MWYMHWTENPANEVQFLECPLKWESDGMVDMLDLESSAQKA